ncbi:SET domain-containing protein [Aspergillus floccosus]
MSLDTPSPSDVRAKPGPAPGGLGNGLFATENIKPGENILHIQSPFVAVLETQRLTDTCSGCFGKRQLESGTELRACTGCQVVKYCDKTCQSKDWKFAHSLECTIFSKLKPRVLPVNARAVLRIVQRRARRKYSSQELDLFLQLETHEKEIRHENAPQWERIALSSKAVKAYSQTDTPEDLISAFGAKLDVNSFNMTTALSDRIGLYLHPYAALINHSCDYNAVVGFDGAELFAKALRPIAQDEQIFISYVDATNPVDIRRKELRERYFFDCRCAKCADQLDTSDALRSAAAADAQRQANMLMEVATAAGIDPAEAVRSLESAMRTLHESAVVQSSTWPITEQPMVSLRDELIASLLAAGRFQTAFVQAAIRVVRVDRVVYPVRGHPIRQLHAWTLARLAIHLSQGMEEEEETGGLQLASFELDYSLLIWSLLSGLVDGEAESCAVPSFKRMVKAALGEVHREFLDKGVDPRGLSDAIKSEWVKVEGLVGAALERGY